MIRHIARLIGIVLVLLVVASVVPAQPIIPQVHGPAAVPGEIVVGFEPKVPTATLQSIAVMHGVTTVRNFPQIGARLMRVGQGEVGDLCANITQLPGVRYAEPNYHRQVLLAAPNDPAYNNLDALIAPFDPSAEATWFQWGLHVVQALEAWNVWPNTYYTSATKPPNAVKVAVIDTGIDFGGTDGVSHPDFINAGGVSPDAAFGGQVDLIDGQNVRVGSVPTDFADDYGHGTAIAGVIGAATNNGGGGGGNGTAGLGYNCQIMPIKAFDNTGNGTEADIVAGILWAVDHGAVVINISAGDVYYSQAEQDAVDYAWEHGALIVAAAGNEGDSMNRTFYPAACTGVMAVGATIWEPVDYPASYSNFGEYLVVSAPGGDISLVPLAFWGTWVPMPTEYVPMHDVGWEPYEADYQYQFGTSVACPFVAGLAALYAGSHGITQSTPGGVWQMWRAILKGCDDVAGLPGHSPNWGWGRINAYQTMMDNDNRQATVGRVTGQVTYYGTVVQNAVVNAVPVGGGASRSATSRSDGMYRLSDLIPGLYDITGTYFGESATIHNVQVEAGVDVPRVYIAVPGGATYSISGTVTDGGGDPVAGVQVSADGHSATTAANGTYTITALAAGTYTVTPSLAGCTFTPVSQEVTVNETVGNATAVDFVGALQGYTISGTVTNAGDPLAGVEVTADGHSATTAANGIYTITELVAGTYTVTPSLAEYTFEPVSREVTVNETVGDATSVDFVGTQKTYSISGTVTSEGDPLEGAEVTADGQSDTTAADGTYTIDALIAGTYTVTPSLANYTFDPASSEQTVNETVGDATDVDFVGTQSTCAIFFHPDSVTKLTTDTDPFDISVRAIDAPTLAGGMATFTVVVPGVLDFDDSTAGGNLVAVTKGADMGAMFFATSDEPGRIDITGLVSAAATAPFDICTITFTVAGTVGSGDVSFDDVNLKDSQLDVIPVASTGTCHVAVNRAYSMPPMAPT